MHGETEGRKKRIKKRGLLKLRNVMVGKRRKEREDEKGLMGQSGNSAVAHVGET